ncbi:hypothetical protein HO173_011346 [Letharia columbiana]|uniref:Uncharacterized protein n=1 Tax=Letharia columbiana TaxID=112416 RepID=A0A8H6FJL4_9LECA|nr:uncharacterized protein HO173_011346 [Letharia columbiana]KAF6229700.1 hypothetical protein HO173_011346 [Letharia columbiana]
MMENPTIDRSSQNEIEFGIEHRCNRDFAVGSIILRTRREVQSLRLSNADAFGKFGVVLDFKRLETHDSCGVSRWSRSRRLEIYLCYLRIATGSPYNLLDKISSIQMRREL